MSQYRFTTTITTVERGENYEAALLAAIATADRIDEILDIAEIVVTDGDGTHLGGPTGVFCEGCRDGVFPGIRWPTAANGDTSHEWVERCDQCQRFDGDWAARDWMVESYGPDTIASEFVVGEAIPVGAESPTPYLDGPSHTAP